MGQGVLSVDATASTLRGPVGGDGGIVRRGASLELGTLRDAPEVTARLVAEGFNQHTFLCGQSGSGKIYSLDRLLEELVLRTRLPLLVLDPNGDHVHLGRTREGIDPAVAAAYAEAARDVRVLAAEPSDGVAPLRIRLRELGSAGVAALVELEPIADRVECNALLHALRDAPTDGYASVEAAMEGFRASGDEVLELIRMRVENLGVDRMSAWAKRSAGTIAELWLQDRPRALIADTSGFEERRELIGQHARWSASSCCSRPRQRDGSCGGRLRARRSGSGGRC